MQTLKTPGVYIEEVPTLPGSIVPLPTAIPAFIGYTEKSTQDLKNVPTEINSLPEFVAQFGGAYIPISYAVNLEEGILQSVSIGKRYFLYEAIELFYENGGGRCYIVSVGDYSENIDVLKLIGGLKVLEEWDDPTLLVFPDGVALQHLDKSPNYAAFGDLQKAAILQCSDLKDRFTIMDIMEGYHEENSEDNIGAFRQNIGVNFLDRGAVYHPWLQTTNTYQLKLYQLVLNDSIASSNLAGALAIIPDSVWTEIFAPDSVTDPEKSEKFKELYLNPPLGYIGDLLKTLRGTASASSDYGDRVSELLVTFKQLIANFVDLQKPANSISAALESEHNTTRDAVKAHINALVAFEKKITSPDLSATPAIIERPDSDVIQDYTSIFAGDGTGNFNDPNDWLNAADVGASIPDDATDYLKPGGGPNKSVVENKIEELAQNIIKPIIQFAGIAKSNAENDPSDTDLNLTWKRLWRLYRIRYGLF